MVDEMKMYINNITITLSFTNKIDSQHAALISLEYPIFVGIALLATFLVGEDIRKFEPSFLVI